MGFAVVHISTSPLAVLTSRSTSGHDLAPQSSNYRQVEQSHPLPPRRPRRDLLDPRIGVGACGAVHAHQLHRPPVDVRRLTIDAAGDDRDIDAVEENVEQVAFVTRDAENAAQRTKREASKHG
jgi:hypothetical protein